MKKNRNPRRHIVAVLFVLMVGLTGTACSRAASDRDASARTAAGRPVDRPNVLLIMTDDQGYGDLACLGNPVLKTPHIDQFYKQSIRLTNFHVCPTCSPTRGALMTGRYTHSAGIWHTIMGRSLMRPEELTLAEAFKANGYATGCFGKWHLGDNYPLRPHDQGFDVAIVNGGGGVSQTPDYFGNDYFDDTYYHNGKPEKFTGYCTDVWFDQAIKFIGQCQKQGRPFFCYLPTNAAHGPYLAPEKYVAMYRDNPRVPSANFYGMLTNIDDNVGRMLQFLDRHHLADNTIFIFTTDNGSSVGVRGNKGYNAGMRGHKGSAYEGGHRVPFFMRWPAGHIGGGRDIDALTAHLDVYPTLVELCGIKRPDGPPLHGRSLVPLLYNKSVNWLDRTLVVDSQRQEFMVKGRNYAVMSGNWRLVNGRELYDIGKDPGQNNNIIDQHAQVAERLAKAYEKYWRMMEPLNKTYVRIGLGHPSDNPARLTCHDWHTHNKSVPWNQTLIRRAVKANGFWAVNVLYPGKYRIELRRWAKEVNLPIDAPLPDDPWITDNRIKTPGKAIHPVKARLSIGSIDRTIDVRPGELGAVFEVELKAGPAKMQTWLIDADGSSRGAYYCYVEKL